MGSHWLLHLQPNVSLAHELIISTHTTGVKLTADRMDAFSHFMKGLFGFADRQER